MTTMMSSNRLRSILYVAYPLLPVSDESAGGAEQMLCSLEQEMTQRGHRTAVAACAGSRVAGELFATGQEPRELDRYDSREQEHAERTVEEVLRRARMGRAFDLVHDKSGSFFKYASALDAPVLATLHLPFSFYRPELWAELAPNVFFNCVSQAQARSFRGLPRMMGVVENGINLQRFPFTREKGGYLLWMGRICEEKGTHVAIDVAARTGLPLILAGQVYPFSYHQRYYEQFVRPRLGGPGAPVRFVDSPLLENKVELLRHARALLVPSLCDETSSLVALEAMACGTPVIAFRRGGIPEVVADGATGILVDTAEEMASAVEQVSQLDPRVCRERVEAHYSVQRMADDYERLYGRVLAEWQSRQQLRAA